VGFHFSTITAVLNIVEIVFLDVVYLILGLMRQNISSVHALKYFPFFFSLFLLVLELNLFGLLPYGFTVTSHFYTTFSLAFIIFFGVVILGFYSHKFNFIKFFVPSGISNLWLLGFLIIIEIVSYLIRPLSLAIRLFANMLAGHTLLYILTTFLFYLIKHYFIGFFWLVFIITFLVFLLEGAICFIQAYVFIILCIIYLNDIYHLKH